MKKSTKEKRYQQVVAFIDLLKTRVGLFTGVCALTGVCVGELSLVSVSDGFGVDGGTVSVVG